MFKGEQITPNVISTLLSLAFAVKQSKSWA
jgi:hypothetical protein